MFSYFGIFNVVYILGIFDVVHILAFSMLLIFSDVVFSNFLSLSVLPKPYLCCRSDIAVLKIFLMPLDCINKKG
jgi:hypothetical protein